jgi:hypothetical protein
MDELDIVTVITTNGPIVPIIDIISLVPSEDYAWAFSKPFKATAVFGFSDDGNSHRLPFVQPGPEWIRVYNLTDEYLNRFVVVADDVSQDIAQPADIDKMCKIVAKEVRRILTNYPNFYPEQPDRQCLEFGVDDAENERDYAQLLKYLQEARAWLKEWVRTHPTRYC